MTPFVEARKVASMLAALAEPTRLRIAFYLARGPHHVSQLAELLDIPIVNMSHHLGVMRQAGLIDDEKQGRRVIYSFRHSITTNGDGSSTLITLNIGTLRVALCTKGPSFPDDKPSTKPKTKK